jgi:hypothetical protein
MTNPDQELTSFLTVAPFDDGIDATHRDRLEQQLLAALARKRCRASDSTSAFQRVVQLFSPRQWAGFATATTGIVLLGVVLLGTSQPTYALARTIEALKQIRFLHVVMETNTAGITDERWIELGADGTQIRYRQDSVGMGENVLIVDDGKTCLFFDRQKNTATLTASDGQSYQWIGNLREFFAEMADDRNVVVHPDAEVRGRKLHQIVWPRLQMECLVDPVTKLPVKVGPHRVTYDPPLPGTFDCTAPAGARVVDERTPSKPAEAAEKPKADVNQLFKQAREHLARGEWEPARMALDKVVQDEPRMNWAWFWLGKANEELGDNVAAIADYTKVIEMFKALGLTPHYCHLARGQVFRRTGNTEAARLDFAVALPVMIQSLGRIEGAETFDYADDFGDKRKWDEAERFQRMVKRLEVVTGVKLDNGTAVTAKDRAATTTAWQKWWTDHAADGKP